MERVLSLKSELISRWIGGTGTQSPGRIKRLKWLFNELRQQSVSAVVEHPRRESYLHIGMRTFFSTNVPLDDGDVCRQMVRRYADRWAVEEQIEFLKRPRS